MPCMANRKVTKRDLISIFLVARARDILVDADKITFVRRASGYIVKKCRLHWEISKSVEL
jgi:hypothetical protein